MKQYILSIVAIAALLASCSKPAPSTTPLHPAEDYIVPTTQDEMQHLAEAMTASDDWGKFMSSELLSLMDEATHLTMGNCDSVAYVPFDWTCRAQGDNYTNDIDSIYIGTDSVNIAMLHTVGAQHTPFTLVMKHIHGKWCVDDIKWQGKASPADTERHLAQDYIDNAVNWLSTSDAGYIVDSRIKPLATRVKQQPELKDQLVKDIETVHNYIKQNRGYDSRLEQIIALTLQDIKNQK